jgi:hypothetical protein
MSDGRLLAIGLLAAAAAASSLRGRGSSLRSVVRPGKYVYDPNFYPDAMPMFTVLHGHGPRQPIDWNMEDPELARYPWMPAYTDSLDFMYDRRVLEEAWSRGVGKRHDEGFTLTPDLDEPYYLEDNSNIYRDWTKLFEAREGRPYNMHKDGLQEAMAMGYSFVKLPDRMPDSSDSRAYRWYFLNPPYYGEGSALRAVPVVKPIPSKVVKKVGAWSLSWDPQRPNTVYADGPKWSDSGIYYGDNRPLAWDYPGRVPVKVKEAALRLVLVGQSSLKSGSGLRAVVVVPLEDQLRSTREEMTKAWLSIKKLEKKISSTRAAGKQTVGMEEKLRVLRARHDELEKRVRDLRRRVFEQ